MAYEWNEMRENVIRYYCYRCLLFTVRLSLWAAPNIAPSLCVQIDYFQFSIYSCWNYGVLSCNWKWRRNRWINLYSSTRLMALFYSANRRTKLWWQRTKRETFFFFFNFEFCDTYNVFLRMSYFSLSSEHWAHTIDLTQHARTFPFQFFEFYN